MRQRGRLPGPDRPPPSHARAVTPYPPLRRATTTGIHRSGKELAGRALPVGHLQDVEHRQGALGLAELELRSAAQRGVRAGIGADATEEAAAHVELVGLED